MKTIILFLSLITLPCMAQYESQNMAQKTGTNVVVAANDAITTSTYKPNLVNGPFVCANTTVDCFVSFQLRGAGTSAVSFTAQKSYDSITWFTMTTFNVTASGNTLATGTTNLSLGNYGYIRISEVNNGNGTGLTNLTVRWSCKNP